MATSSFSVHIDDLEFEPEDLAPGSILAGAPRTFVSILDTSSDGAVLRGAWRITPGVVTDIEGDEIFTVISGRATVETGEGKILELYPGAIGILAEGDSTTWTVHETLTKVYQITVRV